MPNVLTHQRIMADLTRYHRAELATLYDDLVYWYDGKEGYVPYSAPELMHELEIVPDQGSSYLASTVALFEDQLETLRNWAFWIPVPQTAEQRLVNPGLTPEDSPKRLVSIRDSKIMLGERGRQTTQGAIKVRSVPPAGLPNGRFFEMHSGIKIPRVGV